MSVMGIVLLGFGLFLAGAAIGFLLGRRGKSAEHAKFEAVQTEFDDYRREVSAHFGETANRFQSIGRQYKELYEHLASGSLALCDKQAMQEGIQFLPTVMVDPETPVDDNVDSVTATEDIGTPPDEAPETLDAAEGEASGSDVKATQKDVLVEHETADKLGADPIEEGQPDNVVELIPRTENDGDTDDGPKQSGDDPDGVERKYQ